MPLYSYEERKKLGRKEWSNEQEKLEEREKNHIAVTRELKIGKGFP